MSAQDEHPTIGLEKVIWDTIKNGGSWPLVIDTDGRGNFYVMGLDAYLESRKRLPGESNARIIAGPATPSKR